MKPGSLFLAFSVLIVNLSSAYVSKPQRPFLQSLSRHTSRRTSPYRSFLVLNERGVGFGIPTVEKSCGNSKIRTFSGYCNNLIYKTWGSAVTPFRLNAVPRFRLSGLPNARFISNAICAEDKSTPNRRGMSELTTFFGQFIDHTMTETENSDDKLTIRILPGDPVFKSGGVIPFFRTKKGRVGRFSSPINDLSSYIDGASIYGTRAEDSNLLRAFKNGKLSLPGNLLRRNQEGLFLSGDKRVNENIVLTAMHTLFACEHNRLCDEIIDAFPEMCDEDIFQLARIIVGGEMQAIVNYEFVPAVLGQHLRRFRGYNRRTRADISNEFSTVAFRVGHTLLNADVTSMSDSGRVRRRKLRDAFFRPQAFLADGVDGLVRGVLATRAAEVDNGITGEVRNFLVGSPSRGRVQLDLAALNVQRGRDHGVPDYNSLRRVFGLRKVRSFSQITRNRRLQRKLKKVYGSVDRIDPWIGGICEDHVSGSLGPLFARIWEVQFTRLRDGDRFYFERQGLFTEDQIAYIPTVNGLVGHRRDIGQVMRNIIIRNTRILPEHVNRNSFFV